MTERILCNACRPYFDDGIGTKAKHTSPPHGSHTCQCSVRTCACYGIQVAAGVRKS